MRIVVSLTRFCGMSFDDAMGLCYVEAKEWLDVAREIENGTQVS